MITAGNLIKILEVLDPTAWVFVADGEPDASGQQPVCDLSVQIKPIPEPAESMPKEIVIFGRDKR